jgi:hypothetical protein
MNKIFNLSLVLLTTISFSSCSTMISGIYGVKNIKEVDEKTILRHSKKYNIPGDEIYQLDTLYLSYLSSFDSVKFAEQVKNHYQPLQALYYDKSGQLTSFQINCYAGGFPNLDWNRDQTMMTFPPKAQAPIDSLIPLDVQLKYILPVQQTPPMLASNNDYTVIVHWNRFMGRQTKRFIQTVQQNMQLNSDKQVKVIYVNNDNLFTRIK